MEFSLFALLVGFLLPWQTRFIFNVPLIGGVTWNFGITSIFISQIVMALWLVIEAWKSRAHIKVWYAAARKNVRQRVIYGTLAIFFLEQLLISAHRSLTIQWFFGVALLVGVGCVLYKKPTIRIPFAAAFIVAFVLQSLLAAMQVFTGATFASSLLGISAQKATTSGVAVLQYGGTRYLRAYGGQPHPNIFGGLGLVGILLFNWLLKHKRTLGVKKNIIQFAILATAALFFSFSRAAFLGLVIWVILMLLDRHSIRDSQLILVRWCVISFAVLMVIFFPLVLSRIEPATSLEQRAISERVTDIGEWSHVTRKNLFFGTGVGAYTAALDAPTGDRHVPVHSAPLLAFAELGLFGALSFVVMVCAARARIKFTPWLLVVVPIALFDHYLFSLWAGQIIFAAFLFQLFTHEN